MKSPFRGSGIFYYCGKRYKCSLYYNEDGGGIVLQIIHNTQSGIGDYLEFPLSIAKLSGKLDSGFEFTLLKLCRVKMTDIVFSGLTEYTYSAEYLLSGIMSTSAKRQCFSRVNFVLADIVEWGNESIYYIGENYELKSKKESVSKTVYSNLDSQIKYLVVGSYLPCVVFDILKEHIHLEQHGIIEISFSTEHELKDFILLFNKFKRLLEVALLREVGVEKVFAFSNEIKDGYGEIAYERQIDIYGRIISPSKDSNNTDRRNRFNWITFEDLIKNNSFAAYMGKYDKLEPVIDLYVELFHLKGHSSVRTFLNLVQALETYHSRFITNDLKEYKNRILSLTIALPPNNVEHVKTRLMANSKSFITLESRLSDLLYANGEHYFDTGEINHDDFPTVIAKTRNYYIHYDDKLKTKNRILTLKELGIYKIVLFQILEFYILSELGFTLESIITILHNRWGSVSDTLMVLKESDYLQ